MSIFRAKHFWKHNVYPGRVWKEEIETSSPSHVPCFLPWGISYGTAKLPDPDQRVNLSALVLPELAWGMSIRRRSQLHIFVGASHHILVWCTILGVTACAGHSHHVSLLIADCSAPSGVPSQCLLQFLSSVYYLTDAMLLQIMVLIPLPGFPLLSGKRRGSYRPVSNHWWVQGWGMIALLFSWGPSPRKSLQGTSRSLIPYSLAALMPSSTLHPPFLALQRTVWVHGYSF